VFGTLVQRKISVLIRYKIGVVLYDGESKIIVESDTTLKRPRPVQFRSHLASWFQPSQE